MSVAPRARSAGEVVTDSEHIVRFEVESLLHPPVFLKRIRLMVCVAEGEFSETQ